MKKFFSCLHQNLHACHQHFHLVRSSIFNTDENTLNEIAIDRGKGTAIPLKKK